MMYMNFQKKEKINIKIKKLLKRKKYKLIKKKKKSFKKKIILIHLTLMEKGKKT